MSQLFLNPYINFQGKAREAMQFYQQVLGGELVLLAFTPDGTPKPAGDNDRIMHARLESGSAVIMAGDGSPDYSPTAGDNMAITLGSYDRERLSDIFSKLAEGGMVKQPLTEQSWGTFGWLQDKYGINWMLNVPQQQDPAEQ